MDRSDTFPALPAEYLPSDGRFGCGPSKIRPAQAAALSDAALTIMGTSHRKEPVRQLVGNIRAGLRKLLDLPEGYEILLSAGGATAFWDAATFGLIERKSAHLAFGEFSAKFAKAVSQVPWLDAPIIRESPVGTAPDPGVLREECADADVVAWAHNETSTGAMAPVFRPCPSNREQLVVIDATSAAGGLPINVAETDVYYFSPQKCFAADGGLWLAAVSPAAVERIDKIARSERYIPEFLSLRSAVENSRKNQTYNTPAIGTLVLLDNQIRWMLDNGGLEGMVERTRTSAQALYQWAEARPETSPFVQPARARSQVVGTIDFDASVDAAALAATLRANEIVDVESYRKLGRNQLRIGMFPAIEPADIRTLTSAIDYLLDRREA